MTNEEVIRMVSYRDRNKAIAKRKQLGKKAVGRIYKNPSWGMSQKPIYVVSYLSKISKRRKY